MTKTKTEAKDLLVDAANEVCRAITPGAASLGDTRERDRLFHLLSGAVGDYMTAKLEEPTPEDIVHRLIVESGKNLRSEDAMRYSQAAVNAANALAVLRNDAR